jgi:hypothetical protein
LIRVGFKVLSQNEDGHCKELKKKVVISGLKLLRKIINNFFRFSKVIICIMKFIRSVSFLPKFGYIISNSFGSIILLIQTGTLAGFYA